MRTLVGAVTLLGVLLLTGCGGGDPIPTLPPTPSATPIFASEEEALAAAEEAYAAYLSGWDLVASEGGVEPERLSEWAVGDFYQEELEGFETFRDNNWRAVGQSRLHSAKLQYLDVTGQDAFPLAAYVCVDVSALDVVDASGNSVVSPSRPDLQAFEVFFEISSDQVLVPSVRDPWQSEPICGAE